ncbi:MAG: Cro/Cl family transcriptional regulator [Roseateles depolymerans]|uniref:Cro/Cl family transcriptional regulator n=1 Tax=Roseateles depolymerans TaxID=76731 RepID=A0A2W5DBC5_9BURK|nr:MAG: Cro/Cl family transcriptional regulator [Roseateles depolymerans]
MNPAFLHPTPCIDADHPTVVAQARALAQGAGSTQDLVRRCFEFVRDEIRHSSDHRLNPVTCTASDVLRERTGFCYAKSHLLAALLRANGVPAGLCYQRLSMADSGQGAPYGLHGLNAVWLAEFGWVRLDARGNKPGLSTEFRPPAVSLAYTAREPQERDLPEIWAEPLPVVREVLEGATRFEDVLARLPDIELLV